VFVEDLSAFFSTDEHATDATLQGGSVVPVIFDRAYLEQMGIAGTAPAAIAKASDVTAANLEQTLTVNGTAYTIKGREPIDDGAVVLLRLQAP